MIDLGLRRGAGGDRWAPAAAVGGLRPLGSRCSLTVAAAAVACMACATSSGVRPDDPYLTVEAHEREAASEAAHARAAVAAGAPAGDVQARVSAEAGHLSAAKALRDAEAAACSGVLPARIDASTPSVTVHRVEVIRVHAGTAPPAPMKVVPPDQVVGVRMTVHGDLTEEELKALLDCRAARARARGDDGTEPVAVRGATFVVHPAKEGDFTLEIRAPGEEGVREVLRRALLAAER